MKTCRAEGGTFADGKGVKMVLTKLTNSITDKVNLTSIEKEGGRIISWRSKR